MSATCSTCKAPIEWGHTASGERIPMDPQPVPGGNIRLIDGRAHVVGATIDLFDQDDDGVRYVSHFATCPDASMHRAAS